MHTAIDDLEHNKPYVVLYRTAAGGREVMRATFQHYAREGNQHWNKHPTNNTKLMYSAPIEPAAIICFWDEPE